MYLNFYGLEKEPFRLTPDLRFLHLAEAHRNVLATLLSGIVGRKGFLVMTGPIGTGKTTLLHATLYALAQHFKGNQRINSAFLVNPTFSREDFLEAVLDEFEVQCSATSKPKRLAALHEVLLEAQRRGSTSVLFVDEAHLLSTELLEEIRLLSNLDTYQEKLLQIVLSGQPELCKLLISPQLSALRQRVAVRAQLRELTAPESRGYIAERLHSAGLRGSSPFTGAALDAIYELSQGVPRVINLLCDRCLLLGFGAKIKSITAEIVQIAADEFKFEPEAQAADVKTTTTPFELLSEIFRTNGTVTRSGS
jgi:general secretion pathway protein A